jgi:hypothetical protein
MATGVNNPGNSKAITGALPFTTEKHRQIIEARAKETKKKDDFNSGKDYIDEGAPLLTNTFSFADEKPKMKPYAAMMPGLVDTGTYLQSLKDFGNIDKTAQGNGITYLREAVVMDIDAKLIISTENQMRKGIFREAHYPTMVEYIKSDHYKRLRESAASVQQIIRMAKKTKLKEAADQSTPIGIRFNPKLVTAVNARDKVLMKRFRESDIGGFTGSLQPDWDGGMSFETGGRVPPFTPLIAGPYNKQLYYFDYLDMHSKAFEAWTHNPCAKRIVDVIKQFTLGKGVRLTVMRAEQKTGQMQPHPINGQPVPVYQDYTVACQDALDRHWMKNSLHTTSKQILQDLVIFGEQFIRYYDAPWGLRLRSLDPSTIWEVITDPDDVQNEFYCLSGPTKISLLDGRELSVRKARREFKRGKKLWAYSFDEERHLVVPGQITKVWKTGKRRCVKVTLDNGKSDIVSFDHPYLLRDGETYLNAEDLKPGMGLMPLYRKRGYEQVYQPDQGWEQTHQRVASEFRGWKKSIYKEHGIVIDHFDENQANNSPENIWLATVGENNAKARAFYTLRDPEHFAEYYAKISESKKKDWADGVYDDLPKPTPETIAKMHAGRDRSWKTKERRQLQSQSHKEFWADPLKRAKAVNAMRKAANSEKGEYIIRSPRLAQTKQERRLLASWHQERILAAQQSRAESIREYFQDPIYKERHRQKIKAAWKDPQKRERMLNRSYPQKHDDRGRFSNHKVVSVVPAGIHTVYDLTVERFHNFALSSGVFVHNCHQQYPTQYQWYVDLPIPTIKFIIRQIPALHYYHMKINVTSTEKRGRSQLFTVLGYLRRMKEYIDDRIVRNKMANLFVLDISVEGDAAAVQQVQQQFNTPPIPGSWFIHNKAAELKGVAAEIGASDTQADGDLILQFISMGSGISMRYLGGSGGEGGKAGAIVETEPDIKTFEDYQELMEQFFYQDAQRVFVRAAERKEIPGDLDIKVEATYPALAEENRSEKLKDLAFGESMSWWSHRRVAAAAAKEMQFTSYDYDEEQEEIANEDAQKEFLINTAYQQVTKGVDSMQQKAEGKAGGMAGGGSASGASGKGSSGMGFGRALASIRASREAPATAPGTSTYSGVSSFATTHNASTADGKRVPWPADPRDVATNIKREAANLRFERHAIGRRADRIETPDKIRDQRSLSGKVTDARKSLRSGNFNHESEVPIMRFPRERKRKREGMEPFKQQDGDRVQRPRVEHVEDHQGHPRGLGKRMTPQGFGASKQEEFSQ